MRIRLSAKILSLFVAVALLATGATLWASASDEDRIVQTEQQNASQVLIQAIDEGLYATMLSGNKNVARRLIGDMSLVPQILSVAVYRPDGGLWYVDPARADDRLPLAPAQIGAVAGNGQPIRGFGRLRGAEVYQVVAPIPGEESCYKCHERRTYLGAVAVVVSTSAVRARLASTQRLLLASTLGTVALAFVALGAALAFFVVRPISRLASVASWVAGGELGRRAPAGSRDEIGDLARAFNQMTDRLQAEIKDLEDTRAELRETIERVGEAIRSAHKLEDLIDVVVREAARIGPAEVTTVLLFDKRNRLMLRGSHGVDEEVAAAYQRKPFKLSDGIIQEVAANAPECSSRSGSVGDPDRERLGMLPGARCQCVVPIAMGKQVLGFIGLATNGASCHMTEDARRLLGALASQAAIAIQQIRLNEQTKVLAITDGLTGLYNHRFFRQRLDAEIDRAHRFGHQLSLLVLDIDGFKDFNDRFGHLGGDALLEELGTVLLRNTRRVDTAARYGGDEFAVILVETDPQEALAYGERLRLAIDELVPRHAGPHAADQRAPREEGPAVTVSVGSATYPDNAGGPEELIAAADAAMYRAKSDGRNRVAGADGSAR
jgi:diguanylate cyclase (GGDEF)-like protein